MKAKLLLIVTLSPLFIYSQNPFLDGIRTSDVVEFKEDESIRFNGSGFRVIMKGNCHVTYQVNELWNDKNNLSNYITETNWNWQDIATLEVDTIKNILRLNGREPMPKKQKNVDTGELLEDPHNNTVNVYFKTKDLVLAAYKSAFELAKNCGAKVLMIN